MSRYLHLDIGKERGASQGADVDLVAGFRQNILNHGLKVAHSCRGDLAACGCLDEYLFAVALESSAGRTFGDQRFQGLQLVQQRGGSLVCCNAVCDDDADVALFETGILLWGGNGL